MAHILASSSASSQPQSAPDYHSQHYHEPMAPHMRTQTQPASSSSRTQTTTEAPPRLASPPPRLPDATLRLRAGPVHDRRVTWTDDVIDNEGLGRKKSKVCCIFRRAREFGESSSEDDSSDSDSSSDDDASSGADDDGRARPAGGCSHGHGGGSHRHGKRKAKRPPSPNAYEKMPKYSKKPKPTNSEHGHGRGSLA